MAENLRPQLIMRPKGLGPKQMDLTRPPIQYSCPCGRRETLIVPDVPGALVWRCVQCRQQRKVTFVAYDGKETGGGFVNLKSKPLLHECNGCARRDVIALPGGGGEIRWECTCGDIWAIQFTPDTTQLAKVIRA